MTGQVMATVSDALEQLASQPEAMIAVVVVVVVGAILLLRR